MQREQFTPLHPHRKLPTQELEFLIPPAAHAAVKANICFS